MASCLLKFERSLTIGLLGIEEYWGTMHIQGLSKYRKNTQRRKKCLKLTKTKTRKDGQSHAKTDKDTQRRQRHAKTDKDRQRWTKTGKDTQRRTKTRKDGQRHASFLIRVCNRFLFYLNQKSSNWYAMRWRGFAELISAGSGLLVLTRRLCVCS